MKEFVAVQVDDASYAAAKEWVHSRLGAQFNNDKHPRVYQWIVRRRHGPTELTFYFRDHKFASEFKHTWGRKEKERIPYHVLHRHSRT